MTDEQRKLADEHRTIYLQPRCCVDPNEGRQWCEHDVWPCDDCEHGASGIAYTLRATPGIERNADYNLGFEDGLAVGQQGVGTTPGRDDVLVPRQPTEAMIRALDAGLHDKWPNARAMALAAWEAMLSAVDTTALSAAPAPSDDDVGRVAKALGECLHGCGVFKGPPGDPWTDGPCILAARAAIAALQGERK